MGRRIWVAFMVVVLGGIAFGGSSGCSGGGSGFWGFVADGLGIPLAKPGHLSVQFTTLDTVFANPDKTWSASFFDPAKSLSFPDIAGKGRKITSRKFVVAEKNKADVKALVDFVIANYGMVDASTTSATFAATVTGNSKGTVWTLANTKITFTAKVNSGPTAGKTFKGTIKLTGKTSGFG